MQIYTNLTHIHKFFPEYQLVRLVLVPQLYGSFLFGKGAVNGISESWADLVWGGLYEYNASDWWGAGIRYSIDTKIGPISFDISSSNISKNINLYFSLGHYF